MQETPSYLKVPIALNQEEDTTLEVVPAPERSATIWVTRITGLIGVLALTLALAVWLARPNHYRFVLAVLMIAMFAAILHSYTFEDGP